MLKIKKGFILRKMGENYIAVTVGATSKEINGMIRLNETGKFLWEQMEDGIEREDLIQKMMQQFNGLDEKTAETDLDEFLKSIEVALVN